MDQAIHTFIVEARELLDDMEAALLDLDPAQPEAEAINAIFRAAHTIKGSAGLFGLDRIVHFTHVVESLLDRVREQTLALNPDLVALLLGCADHSKRQVDAVEAGELDSDDGLEQEGRPLLEGLQAAMAGGASPATVPAMALTSQTSAQGGLQDGAPVPPGPATGEGAAHAQHWHLSLRFGPDVLRNGMDPAAFLRYLGKLGRIAAIVTVADALPPLAELDAEQCYLGFEIAFESAASKAEIASVFEFVQDECRIAIVPPHSRIADYLQLIAELPEGPSRVGEILSRCGTLTEAELARALQVQQRSGEAAPPLGEILVAQGAVPPVVVDAALRKQSQVREARHQESASVRVDAAKLDQLINQIGELIIASASASLASRRSRDADLIEYSSAVSQLVESVRDSALQLRMVKIGATFSRFQRVVHDVARELGKDIALQLSGEDTELDKTVVEKIGDPLTHLVRNAMDHGIEPVEQRLAQGKPAQGTVSLNAYHDSGSIVIEVGDDGGGLKRERILAKAVERGLVEPGRVLSDGEVYALIFEPGFSTAEAVTNLSGRGVGMDVVKSNITALRGSVDVHSIEGQGTTVTVRLPLTLAIINGFQVSAGGSTFVIPLDMVEECVAYSCEAGQHYTNLRGEVLPFVRLREVFDLGQAGEVPPRQNIVVVRHGRRKAGVVVDALHGELQTVIKPLGKMFQRVRAVSGSTILGSGEVALILDVPALLQEAASAVAPDTLAQTQGA
ncbi:MAG: chemotaxis protein CheA [Burkholderiaceae bacterium]|nr:chemotaxis protein CheA [Burkholderiaceae bacterium]